VVAGLDHGVSAVGVGADFTCALSTAGEVLCFGGIIAYGQLSNGPAATDGRPGRIVPLRSSAVGLVVGGYTVCAELTDGTTWCWGSGYGDIRGDGNRDGTAEPVQRRSNDVPRTLRISQSLACGVQAVEATPACFGGTLEGSPHSVAGVAPAEGFGCVLLRDGRVTCQGANNWGQLGDGTTTARFAPATVIGFG
jgi:alpha-tubulin suppressor-like RCC1 family protein